MHPRFLVCLPLLFSTACTPLGPERVILWCGPHVSGWDCPVGGWPLEPAAGPEPLRCGYGHSAALPCNKPAGPPALTAAPPMGRPDLLTIWASGVIARATAMSEDLRGDVNNAITTRRVLRANCLNEIAVQVRGLGRLAVSARAAMDDVESRSHEATKLRIISDKLLELDSERGCCPTR